MKPIALSMVLMIFGNALAQDTTVQESIKYTTMKTPYSSWSKESVLKLKWGMGPADVINIYPELKLVVPDSTPTLQANLIKLTIQNITCSVKFTFRLGRLCMIDILPKDPNKSIFNGDYTTEQLNIDIEKRWQWRLNMITNLKNQYGHPLCEPSDYTIHRFYDNIAPPRGFDKDREKLMQWIWRTQSSEITMSGGALPVLVFRDITTISAVDYEKKAALEYFANTGNIPKYSTDLMYNQNSNEPPAINCPIDETAMGDDISTPQDNWSRFGWNIFKWGMGPGDVQKAIIEKNYGKTQWIPKSPQEKLLFISDNFEAFGEQCTLLLHFSKNNLDSIMISPILTDEELLHGSGKKINRWITKITSEYTKKGIKMQTLPQGDINYIYWMKPPEIWSKLTTSKNKDGNYLLSDLYIEDPNIHPSIADLNYSNKSTQKTSWSSKGWLSFRWGMGPNDVIRRVNDKNGDIKYNNKVTFFVNKQNRELATCLIESDSHTYNIMGQKPDITFEFIGGKLSQIDLKFKETKDDALCNVRNDFKEMLIIKYGDPSEKDDSKVKNKTFYNRLHWKTKDLNISFFKMSAEYGCETSITYYDPKFPDNYTQKKLVGSPEINKF